MCVCVCMYRVHCLAIIVNLDNNNRKAFRSARTAYHFKLKKDAMLCWHTFIICVVLINQNHFEKMPINAIVLWHRVIFCYVGCCQSKHAACGTCALFSSLFFFATLCYYFPEVNEVMGPIGGNNFFTALFAWMGRSVCAYCAVSCVGIYFICSAFVIFAMAPFITCTITDWVKWYLLLLLHR